MLFWILGKFFEPSCVSEGHLFYLALFTIDSRTTINFTMYTTYQVMIATVNIC